MLPRQACAKCSAGSVLWAEELLEPWSYKWVIAAQVRLSAQFQHFRGDPDSQRQNTIDPGNKKLIRESQNIWKSKTTNHESRQHLISRLLSCTCTVLTIFVVIWGVWEAVSYLLQKKSWHSQVCSSSQWNVKPWHPQHILFEAIEQTKTKLQKKRRKLRKRKWGDAGVWGEGMWEQTGWVVALVHEVNSACKRNRIHIPVLAPSPACQGAFMTWADTWNILSSLPKQRMCPVNVSIRRYSAEGGAGRIALPAMTTAWVSSCVSCVLSPASLKG